MATGRLQVATVRLQVAMGGYRQAMGTYGQPILSSYTPYRWLIVLDL